MGNSGSEGPEAGRLPGQGHGAERPLLTASLFLLPVGAAAVGSGDLEGLGCPPGDGQGAVVASCTAVIEGLWGHQQKLSNELPRWRRWPGGHGH